MSIVGIIAYGVGILAGLAGFVCFIMVLVKSFQRSGAGIGIVGIITCGIATFIWGWIKSKEFNLTKIMLLWTVALVISIGANTVAGIVAVNELQNNPEFRKAIEDAQRGVEEAAREAQQPVPAPVE